MSYRSLRALDVKSQTVIAKSPCRSVCQCLTETLHLPAALYDTKEKTGKTVGVWLLVLGCRFLVNNACLMEDSQESRLINPKPITLNLQPAPSVFPVFPFDVFVAVRAYGQEVGVKRRLTRTLGTYSYGRCEAASI